MNNNKSSSTKSIIIFIAVIVVAGLLFFYFLGNKTPDSNSSIDTEGGSSETQIAGARVLTLLNQVSSLKIDKSLFDSASYRSLVDYTVNIPEQNVGRPNPFAPIGGITNGTSTAKGR